MWRSLVYSLALALAAALTLQGCGGDEKPKPQPASGSTTTTTTTTTTTEKQAPGGLRWCEEISTFYKTTYSKGEKNAAGQCLPSVSPGAYYTKPGEKGDDDKSDRLWSCFSPDFSKSLWTNEAAKAHDPPFEGACLFKDYSNQDKPADVDFCNKYLPHHPSVCAPGPAKYWGACWSSHSENWKCIMHNDTTIPGLAKGDCKAAVVAEPAPSTAPTKYLFDGVCRFKNETAPIYKCDTVPGYNAENAGTCGQTLDKKTDKACFALEATIFWQCMEAGTDATGACDWTLLPGDSAAFYTGFCVFPRNEQYKKAMDAQNLTTASLIV